jgi:outer membrane autotransporter protein
VDYQINPNLLLGFALGGSASSFSVPDRLTSGTVDGGHLGGYGVATAGSFYAAGALSFAAFDDRINRTIAGIGPTELTRGSFTSDLATGRLEIGNKWSYGNMAVTPFAAAQFSELWQRGFAETGTASIGTPGVLGLNYASHTTSSAPTFLGAQFDTRVAFANGMVWSPYLRASWVHEFNPTRNLTATFETLPLATFTVDGPRAARDAGRLEAGSKVSLSRSAWLYASFDGEFSSRSQTYAGKGGFKIAW